MNIRKLYEDKKEEILFVGGLVIGVAITYAYARNLKIDINLTPMSKEKFGNNVSDLREVKDFLESNKNNNMNFGIFREGNLPGEYQIVEL